MSSRSGPAFARSPVIDGGEPRKLQMATLIPAWWTRGWQMNKGELLKTYIVPIFFPILSIVDGMVIWFARIFPRKTPANNVVFVRTDNLGDFILWLPTASALRQQWPWPGCRFALVGNPNWVELARSLRLFDEIIGIDRKKFQRRPGYRFLSLWRLAHFRAELLVNPIHLRDPLSSDTIARAISAKRKLAARGDTSNALGQHGRANRWYDELIDSGDFSIHQAIRNHDFLARLCGIQLADPWPSMPKLESGHRSPELPNGPYALIAAGAEASLRVWPMDRFAHLAEKLARQTSLQVVLVGSPSERSLLGRLERLCSVPVINLAGKLAVQDVVFVAERAKLIITNETGAAHLGAALRVPTVCITGGGHFKGFVPYPKQAEGVGIKLFPVYHEMPCFGCDWRCIYNTRGGQAAPCISAVSVEAAWQAIKTALDSAPAPLTKN
jgi:ADP-heptose:LPS heptosyltransferase